MPAEGGSTMMTVASSEFAGEGQIIWVKAPGAPQGYFQVLSILSPTILMVRNLRNTPAGLYLSNSAPGSAFPSTSTVSPGGLQGPAGTPGTTNLTENEVVYAGAGGLLDGVNLNTGTIRFLTQASSAIPTWTDLYGGSNTWGGTQNFQSSIITVGAPSGGLSVVNRDYVDARVTTGFRNLPECDVATTANIALTGIQTIDGIAGSAGKRVLVKDQTTTSQNGIYVMAAGAWTRSVDCDTATEITMGAYVYVKTGAANGASSWSQTLLVITIGTDPVLWQLFSRQTNPWAGYTVPPFATSPPAGNGWMLHSQINGILSWNKPQWYDYHVPTWQSGAVDRVLVFESYESGYIQLAWKTVPAGPAGTNGLNAFTTTTSGFTMPGEGASVTVQVASSEFAALNQIVFVQSGAAIGFFSIVGKPTATSLQLVNLRNTVNSAYLINSVPGTAFATPALVTPGGLQGVAGTNGANGSNGTNGLNAFTLSTVSFTMPAEGANITVQVVSSAWAALNQIVFVQSGASIGFFSVASKPNATSLQLTNLRNTANSAYLVNSAAGTTFSSAATVTPGGLQGPQGTQGPTGPAGGGGGFTNEVTVTKDVSTSELVHQLLWTITNIGDLAVGMEFTAVVQDGIALPAAPNLRGVNVIRCLGSVGREQTDGNYAGDVSAPIESADNSANVAASFIIEVPNPATGTARIWAAGSPARQLQHWRVTMRVFTRTGVMPTITPAP